MGRFNTHKDIQNWNKTVHAYQKDSKNNIQKGKKKRLLDDRNGAFKYNKDILRTIEKQ